jgi:hypothetical protein
VHSKPGLHTREAVSWLTGERQSFEVEGGTAAFLRLQGGLAAAGGSSTKLRIRRTYRESTSRYGDVLKRPFGLRIVDGDVELFTSITREPGRWLVVAESRVGETVEALRAAAQRPSGLTVDPETGEILTT